MNVGNVKTLSKEEILFIYDLLVKDAANSDDPISPSGIKSEALLESAIARQYTSFADAVKYDDAISNAATLCYGICCNHPFYNGNKRAALVSLLCHLDNNNLTFSDKADKNTLFSFMLKIASHKIIPTSKYKKIHDQSDAEISEMIYWIRKKTRKIEKGEKSLSYPEFEKILRMHDIYFIPDKNSYVDVIRKKKVYRRKNIFSKKEEILVEEKIGNIPYWKGRSVGKNLIKSIRSSAKLTAKDGVDSALFYGKEITPDDYIQKYKKVLNKLAKT